MHLITLREFLSTASSLQFLLSDGTAIPSHFHITEIALIDKQYIDCGGERRKEKYITLQIWVAHDTDHRLSPQKLLQIITMDKNLIGHEKLNVVFEYQGQTIEKRNPRIYGENIILDPLFTSCLAQDSCGIK